LKAADAVRPTSPRRGEKALLQGKLFDDRGNVMTPVHTTKGARRCRYYLSRAKLLGKGEPGSLARISAGLLEGFLAKHLEPKLAAGWMSDAAPTERVGAAICRMTIGGEEIVAELAPEARPASEDGGPIRLPFHPSGRGRLIAGASVGMESGRRRIDRALVRAVVLARCWARRLELGEVASIRDIARQHRLCLRYTARLLPLAYLAPDLLEAVMDGRQPRNLTLKALIAGPLPRGWNEQRQLVHSLI
jgi:site-specific DNA recombinase